MQNLYNDLEELLKEKPEFVVGGKLSKSRISDAAYQSSETLFEILLGNSSFKKQFFMEVGGALVFKQKDFLNFLKNKDFLPNSFTEFKNEIGLQDESGEYYRENTDVVLVFPYKDCVLEGGQDKEDQKRNEIFYNETLAPDEITRLKDPKALTNFKLYDSKGEHTLNAKTEIDFSKQNLLLKGNNLLALHSLKPLKSIAGQIKLIYIDPPYNTGSDTFHYNDRFNHSTWLVFMKNRLEIAKKLLSRDGVICVHCDENEQSYLKVLMDEIFERKNFINSIVIKTKSAGVSGTHAGKSFQKSHETIHVYCNDESIFEFVEQQYLLLPFEDYLNEMKDDDKSFKYTTVLVSKSKGTPFKTIKDGYGKDINIFKVDNYTTKSVSRLAKEEGISEIDTFIKYFDKIFTTENAQTSIRTRVQQATDNDENMYYIEYFPKSGKNKGQKATVHFVGTNKRLVSWFSNVAELNEGRLFKKEKLGTLWDKLNWNNVTREGGVKFPNGQKPEQLLQLLISTFTSKGDIVLDYHLGSGTTAAVAFKMNRIFIGIEQLDFVDDDSLQRLKNVIGGDPTGISEEINWQGGGSFVYAELKRYNQQYIDEIEKAKDSKQLRKLYEQMKTEAFFRIEIVHSKWNIGEFDKLGLKEQKELLCACLDKNNLYVNLTEMEDAYFKMSKDDIALNKKFYNIS